MERSGIVKSAKEFGLGVSPVFGLIGFLNGDFELAYLSNT